MKKWYKIAFILFVISLFLSKKQNVFAAEYDENWVNWSYHNMNDPSYPVCQYGYYSNNTDRPWYYCFLTDTNKGIIIKYNNPRNTQGIPTYYYLSFYNTSVSTKFNAITNGSETLAPVKYETGSNLTIIDSDFNSLFHLRGRIWCTTYQPVYGVNIENYDVECSSSQDLYNTLNGYDWANPNDYDPNLGNMPYFYLKVVGPSGNHNTFMGDVEYTLTWDTTNSFITDQRNYYIQVYCWSGNQSDFFSNWNHKKAINNSDTSPYNMGMVAFTWSFVDMERLWLMNNWAQHHFKISLRIVDSTGTPVNNKWVNFTVTKMYEITSSSLAIDENGAPTGNTTNLGERTDGVFQYTDGRPTGDNTNGEGGINSNGSSVSPQAAQEGITNYTPTYDYGNYNFGSSLKSLEQSLTEMVQTIGLIPSLFSQVVAFIPSWLISLIGVSIGMLVLIGVVKTLTK